MNDFVNWQAVEAAREAWNEGDDAANMAHSAYESIACLLEHLADLGWERGGDHGVWLRERAIDWRKILIGAEAATREAETKARTEAEDEASRIAEKRERQPRTPRCEATRKDGQPCRVGRKDGSPYCRHHQYASVAVEAS